MGSDIVSSGEAQCTCEARTWTDRSRARFRQDVWMRDTRNEFGPNEPIRPGGWECLPRGKQGAGGQVRPGTRKCLHSTHPHNPGARWMHFHFESNKPSTPWDKWDADALHSQNGGRFHRGPTPHRAASQPIPRRSGKLSSVGPFPPGQGYSQTDDDTQCPPPPPPSGAVAGRAAGAGAGAHRCRGLRCRNVSRLRRFSWSFTHSTRLMAQPRAHAHCAGGEGVGGGGGQCVGSLGVPLGRSPQKVCCVCFLLSFNSQPAKNPQVHKKCENCTVQKFQGAEVGTKGLPIGLLSRVACAIETSST